MDAESRFLSQIEADKQYFGQTWLRKCQYHILENKMEALNAFSWEWLTFRLIQIL